MTRARALTTVLDSEGSLEPLHVSHAVDGVTVVAEGRHVARDPIRIRFERVMKRLRGA